MSIQNISSSGIPGKPSRESSKNESVNHTHSSTQPARQSDRVEISGPAHADHIDLAKSVLSKIDDQKIRDLQQIKKNINEGVYQSAEAEKTIIKRLAADLQKTESFGLTSPSPKEPAVNKASLSNEQIEFLTQSKEVEEVITRNITADLKKL